MRIRLWSNGTCERMMREVVHTLKDMSHKERRTAQDWVELAPAVQWALNTAFGERYGSPPYHAMFGRASRIALSTLASSTGHDWQVDVVDEKALRAKLQSVVTAQSQQHKEVLEKVQANRGKKRAVTSRGSLPILFVGDYVLVARVRRSGSTPKLLMTRAEPGRVVVAQRPHVYGVQKIVHRKLTTFMLLGCAFTDAAVGITAEVKEVFQHALTQGVRNGSNCGGRIRPGGENEENTWKHLAQIRDAAPQYMTSELRQLGLKRDVRTRLYVILWNYTVRSLRFSRELHEGRDVFFSLVFCTLFGYMLFCIRV